MEGGDWMNKLHVMERMALRREALVLDALFASAVV